MKNKKLIIAVLSVLLFLILGGISLFLVKTNENKKHNEYYDSMLAKADSLKEDFDSADTLNEKLKIISETKDGLKDVSEEKAKYYSKDVEDKYISLLDDMKKYFADDYNKVLTENTMAEADLTAATDKEAINAKSVALDELAKRVDSEKDIVELSEKDYENINKSITDAKALYTATIERINAEEIAKAEAERIAAEQAAAEEARKAEEAKKAEVAKKSNSGSKSSGSSNKSNSGSSNSSSNSGSSSNKSSGSSKIPHFDNEDEKYAWIESLTWDTVPYYDFIVTNYDKNGNVCGHDKVWGDAHYPESGGMYWGGTNYDSNR